MPCGGGGAIILPPIRVTQTLVFIGLASNFNTHTKVSNLQTSLDSKIYPSNIPFLYSNKMYSTLETKKSKSDLKSKPLDSQSLISQLFNPKFLDSNSNLKPLYSRINVKIDSNCLESNVYKDSLKFLDSNPLILNRLISQLLSLIRHRNNKIYPLIKNNNIINICYNIFSNIKVNILNKSNNGFIAQRLIQGE
ncbi:hypothetical protein [Helicobacter apodemus]|uniref:Uncharacterized protein n=1 Tax=Helicobacter apodemus TaxID=135569 RepID=A0A2U8FFI3_9HELI|nr:hypothetical protein [Helicobacter apodemus]AWI34979.1 hypothetical protein CDV25_09560 [Helicobacter apodemus]